MNKTGFPDWKAPDWQGMSEQYWRGVGDLSKQMMAGKMAQQTPWNEGIEQWSRMFQPKDANSTYEQLMEQSKAYLGQMESMFKHAAQGGPVDVRKLFGASADQWQQQQPWLSGLGDYAKWFKPETFAPMMNAMHGDPKALLQLPTLGLAREQLERAQALAANVMAYQREMSRYNALMSKSLEAAVRLMEDKLTERSEPGREITSAKALYDLWIDALEESYAEVALSDEFQAAYGDLVDAQMRVRGGVQSMVEKLTADLGMPTRTEIDSVHRKQAEMRRQLRASAAADVSGLSAEIAELRAELARLKSELKASVKITSAAPAEVTKPAANKASAPTRKVLAEPVASAPVLAAKMPPPIAMKSGAMKSGATPSGAKKTSIKKTDKAVTKGA